MLLALDTATRYMSIALHDGDTLLAEQTWHTGNRHNELLANSLQQMMTVCGVQMTDLSVVAVANGPGSYTGLRIGVAFAKGIAAVRHLPLVGVSTLDILAAGQPFQNARNRLIPVVQAGRGRVIAGLYRVRKGRWEATAEPQIHKWNALLDDLEEGSYAITGEIDEKGRQAIEAYKTRDGLSLTLVAPVHRARRAGFLAQEAWRRYTDGDPQDFAAGKVLPVYLNTPG